MKSPLFKDRSGYLKSDPYSELKCSRSAGAECLREPGGWLTESGAGKVAAITGQIRGVVQIERLTDERHSPPLTDDKAPGQADIERLEGMVERKACRETDTRDEAVMGIDCARV